ncbi:polysaccharide deacetylase family protein [Bradyrhizobium sp. LMTR 3]|uniref:polysaccharide deacetylase family protein n=1 Tax=Bradyrhizobium sp. LMTR 3 TaxID=189873 RepID=UPI0008109289|nr:polysaccharide deacetylase family protein [Bradyrhizobium sp. LMTR 3]OCK56573.1 hypothetical protein LMTR3_12975 [Bradyrhizobium sp. LMTR 3]
MAAATLITFVAAATAAECPRKDALGTSRVLAVDAATYPRVGLKSFPQTLPLEDREVVLTFDDGPWQPTDQKILAALAQECVRATFFLLGRRASEHPELVRRMAAQGHTIAHHTAQTAAMLPAFLRYLRDNHYRVVHLVPADAKTVSGKAH